MHSIENFVSNIMIKKRSNLVWEVQWQGRTAHRPCTRGSGGKGSCRSSCRCRSPGPPPPAPQSCGFQAWWKRGEIEKVFKAADLKVKLSTLSQNVQSAGYSCHLDVVTFIFCSNAFFANEYQPENWVWIQIEFSSSAKRKKGKMWSKMRKLQNVILRIEIKLIKFQNDVKTFLMNSTESAKLHLGIIW